MSLSRRLLVILSISVAAMVAFPAAALADENLPPNESYTPNNYWYGEWEFQNANEWSYALSTASGYVTGTGYDDNTLRLFSGAVTDTSPSDDICTYLTFSEPGGAQVWGACNGTVSFEHYDLTPATYTFTIEVMDSATPHNSYAVARMVVPSTKNRPDLRSDGVGASWHHNGGYYGGPTAGTDFEIVRPNAVVRGHAHGSGNRDVTMTTYAFTCARTLLFDRDAEAMRWEGCNTAGTVTAYTVNELFEVRSCLIEPISINGSPGRPGVTKCVPLLVV